MEKKKRTTPEPEILAYLKRRKVFLDKLREASPDGTCWDDENGLDTDGDDDIESGYDELNLEEDA